jgi:hypothetical protein
MRPGTRELLATSRWRVTAVTVGLLMSVTACSTGPTHKLEPRLQRMVPTERPTLAVTARSGQPAETRLVSGKFFSMYVPANFQEKLVPMANGEKMSAYDAPSSKPATPVRVGVIPDPNPKKTMLEQSFDVELLQTAKGMKNLTRSTVEWPGARSAILLQWLETPSGGSTDNPQRNWHIMAEVNDHLIVNVIAFAPADEFDTAGLPKIFETFRPHA